MSRKSNNDSKTSGWSDWAVKKNDWNISKNNDKRPKLDIHKNHLSQTSSSTSKTTTIAVAGPSTGRGGSFRRTNSMPTSSKDSPVKDDKEFVDTVQEEFEAMEAARLAEAATAIELEIAQSQQIMNPAKELKKQPTFKNLIHGNNGSSGFEILFQEEIAAEDVEECMLLASQEIQASQNAQTEEDTSFSQAYAVFSKGVDAQSSILETGPSFKKPSVPVSLACAIPLRPTGRTPMPPPTHRMSIKRGGSNTHQSSTSLTSAPQSRSHTNVIPNRPSVTNPQAEAEVRRLSKVQDENTFEIKRLKESLRNKEGEASILRSQLKQAIVDRDQHLLRSARSAEASERQYNEKLSDLGKELEALKVKLRFQEAEANAAKERNKLLSSSTERLRLVEPHSPGSMNATQSVSHPGPSRTPSRQKYLSSFLNRSTFEDASSTSRPAKRARIYETDEPAVIRLPPPEPHIAVLKPETRTVGEQTDSNFHDFPGAQMLSPLTLGQTLSERLLGIQLASLEFLNTELWKNNETCIGEKETIPTLSLLKEGLKSKQHCDILDDLNRPRLVNCAQSLRQIMGWDDPVTDCPPTNDSIQQILEECCGILHYNLLLLQDVGYPSDKELRDRDQDIVSRGLEVLPLRNFDLLDEKQWHKEEQGVEMRRCLGILSEIALLSPFGASLVIGALEQNEPFIKRHKFTKLPEYSFVSKRLPIENDDRFYLLRVLCDICSIIVEQKLTIAFNGVLAGILTLLKNCAQHNIVKEESQSYFLKIIHHVLLARPSSFVLLSLVDVLTSLSSCQAIMKGLCTKCDDDDNLFHFSQGFFNFTKSTCALQLICIQLRPATGAYRWRLIDSFFTWLTEVIAQGFAAPSWILCTSDQSHVACCVRITTTITLLLLDAFEMLQEIQDKEECPLLPKSILAHDKEIDSKATLIRIIRQSIIILLKLVDNHMFKFMAGVEALYELLVHEIERVQEHLNMSPASKRCLDDLLNAERDTVCRGDQASRDSSHPHFSLYLCGATENLKLL